MRAKKEYSDHFDFNMMKKFNLNFQARLLNVVIVFDTKKNIFLGLKLKREKKSNRSKNKHYYFYDCNVYISS